MDDMKSMKSAGSSAVDQSYEILKWYARIWAGCQLILLQNFASNFGSVFEIVQGLVMVAVVLVPRRKFFCAGLSMRIVATAIKMPYVHDSKNWWLQTDLAVLVLLLTKSEKDIVPTLRGMMALYYFFAALWKVNTSFLDTHYSCGSVFIAQLAIAYLPESVVRPEVGALITQTSPFITLGVEFTVAIALWQSASVRLSKIGIFLAVLLHFGIAITPSPNSIVSFGVGCLVRLFLFLEPHAALSIINASFMLESYSLSNTLIPIFVWAGAACIATFFIEPMPFVENGIDPTAEGAGVNKALFYFAALALVILIANFKRVNLSPHRKRPRLLGSSFIFLAFCYGLGGPLLGFQDLGSANMFANFRLYGGSNHLFLPAGLLQRYEIGPYKGGILRIEDTNSTWIRHIINYPGDLTSAIDPKALALLTAGGHSAKYFNSMLNVESSPRIYPRLLKEKLKEISELETKTPFIRFTIPASDLQRLLTEARRMNEYFSLTYSKIPGSQGDEAWRAHAVEYTVSIGFDQDGTLVHCLSNSEPCQAGTVQFLLSTPPWLVSKFLLAMPHPILEDNATELHCFGP